ncbi:zinc finger protein 25-like [Centruroides sculpturatus]|uniref:zinc finger protein 25-like n=1 Tax=Centruroides sculpturatus TaxID=218467 RepID=UPI000C6DA49D|nr:zinc finger protein 25-like [Centruroides sculpturatus]
MSELTDVSFEEIRHNIKKEPSWVGYEEISPQQNLEFDHEAVKTMMKIETVDDIKLQSAEESILMNGNSNSYEDDNFKTEGFLQQDQFTSLLPHYKTYQDATLLKVEINDNVITQENNKGLEICGGEENKIYHNNRINGDLSRNIYEIKFSPLRMLNVNANNFMTGKQYQCNICKKRFIWNQTLKCHLIVHNGNKHIKCRFCQRRFATKSVLKKHLWTAYKKKFLRRIRKHFYFYNLYFKIGQLMKIKKRTFTCDICNERFFLYSHLEKHKNFHSFSKYHCNVCNKNFTYKSNLTKHQKYHCGKRPFPCGICDKRFKYRLEAIQHQLYHMEEKPFKCGRCGMCFKTKMILLQHEQCHSEKWQEECFNYKPRLRTYQKYYYERTPFQCKSCRKYFKYKTSLKDHQKCHTREKPYQCEYCKKCFARQPDLRQHQICHSDERPFLCEFCQACFKSKKVLIQHQRCHAEKSPFQCELCGKNFNRKSHLTTHQRYTYDDGSFQCECCEKTFKSKSCLIYHQNILL